MGFVVDYPHSSCGCAVAGHPGVANVAAVLLLALAAPPAGRHGEEEDPAGQRRADRRPGAGHAPPLVRGGRGRREGEDTYMLISLISQI